MNTLPLEQISKYLPYDVKIIGNTRGQIETLSTISESSVNIKGRSTTYGMWADIQDIKLILRPLSDLVKKIKWNGNHLVPLQSMCRKFAYNEQYLKEWNFGVRNGIYFVSATDEIMTRLFEYNSIEKIFILSNPRDRVTMNCKQFELFEYMFENHFDVFGLIDAGLAIDINKIKETV